MKSSMPAGQWQDPSFLVALPPVFCHMPAPCELQVLTLLLTKEPKGFQNRVRFFQHSPFPVTSIVLLLIATGLITCRSLPTRAFALKTWDRGHYRNSVSVHLCCGVTFTSSSHSRASEVTPAALTLKTANQERFGIL